MTVNIFPNAELGPAQLTTSFNYEIRRPVDRAVLSKRVALRYSWHRGCIRSRLPIAETLGNVFPSGYRNHRVQQ